MKTETQIAQENVENLKNFQELYGIWNDEKLDGEKRRIAEGKVHKLVDAGLGDGDLTIISETHKATCQRFLDFLEKNKLYNQDKALNKITDLKQAIKLYNEVGI